MSKIVIFGSGPIAKLAHFYFKKDSNYEIVAFTVDKEYKNSDTYLSLPLVDFEEIEELYPSNEYKMFIALSYSKMNKNRAKKYYQTKEKGYELVSYISSKCTFLAEEPTGDNCFILEDNTIQPFVKIGSNVTIWSGNHIGHDSIINDHVFISSHVVISGFVEVKSYCFLGVNSTLRDSITIAPETLIGAGAIIMNNTVEKGVYLPERAKLFNKKSDEINL